MKVCNNNLRARKAPQRRDAKDITAGECRPAVIRLSWERRCKKIHVIFTLHSVRGTAKLLSSTEKQLKTA